MSDSPINYTINSQNNTHYSHNIDSFNINHSFNTVYNLSIDVTEERSEILAWLSPLEPRTWHQLLRTHRADNVGEWLLQTDEFQRWRSSSRQEGSDHAILFCCGDPAVGKTYFSSLVVDRLCDKAKEQDIAVACFYVDFAARGEQSPTDMLGSLLKQIVGGLERIPDEIRQMFQDHKKVIGGRRPQVAEIIKMLQIVTSLQPTFICVDALDECVEEHRPEILGSLRTVLEKSLNTRIFLTGRRYIQSEVERSLGGRVSILSIKPSNDDIVEYIRMRLKKDTSPDAMNSGLEDQIIKRITENNSGTFLLVSLTMDAVLGETTAYGRRQRLRAMTEGLDLKGVYGATLERIKEQGGEKARLGVAALMWISHSERLLRLDELSHALAVDIGSVDLNAAKIPSAESLLSCCLGLVVVDREASTVRLIHLTLQEYLCTCPDLFGPTHSVMAETCLTYLNFWTTKDTSPTLSALPFIKYSSLYWGVHAKKEPSPDMVPLALKLFSQIESHISTKLLLADLISRTGRYNHDIPINGPLVGFTGLHCASVFGIAEIATTLMDQPNYELNRRDFLGITPLIWAALCGQEGLAKLLLKQQTVNPDKPDRYFRRTALAWAARKGHERIVELFLELASTNPDGTDGWWGKTPRVMNIVRRRRYVNPNRQDKYGQTAIYLAAEEGHEGVVKLLLGRKDVKPDMANGYGRTPLWCASGSGRDGVVKLLVVRQDVSIDRADKNGETPLLAAAECGSEAVVGLLLWRKNVNPNKSSKAGRTPVSLASEKGHNRVVELLLDREDVNPNMPDDRGRTPLLLAAARGRDGVVKVLLGREDVNPNMPDNRGQTPLLCAAANWNDGALRLLLGREGINPNMLDNDGQTLLSLAARTGRGEIVKLLLGREDINPDTQDNYGKTPLSWGVEKGHCGVVELLLGRGDLNPDMPDNRGQTPLLRAAANGNDGVVKLLLGREGINPDIPDNHGRTPLSQAAEKGHDGVLKLLLGREDVNPDRPDIRGQTPLSWAAEKGNDAVVKLLLGREGINPDRPDIRGQTPLSWAAEKGNDRVMKLLLDREGVNPNTPDNCGQTPLSWAAERGHEGAVKLLLAAENVKPDMRDNLGRTPLWRAAEYGREEVVKLLFVADDINPDMPDGGGRTPLSRASEKGYEGVVKLLLGREDVNPDMPDVERRTPLSWAAQHGREGVVRLLLERRDVNPDGLQPWIDPTPLQFATWRNDYGIIYLLRARKSGKLKTT